MPSAASRPLTRRELRELERRREALLGEAAATAPVDTRPRDTNPTPIVSTGATPTAPTADATAEATAAATPAATNETPARRSTWADDDDAFAAVLGSAAASPPAGAADAATTAQPDANAPTAATADDRSAAVAPSSTATPDAETAVTDMFGRTPSAAPAGGGRSKPPRKGRTRAQKRGAWILVAVLVVVLGGGTAGVVTAWKQLSPTVSSLFGKSAPTDYTGDGNGTAVAFTISKGDIGSDIARNLAKAGITRTYEAPYKLLLASPDVSFQPGSYSMQEHMSAASAIQRLQDPAARVVNKLVIPEGTTLKGIVSLMATATKLPVAQVQAAAANYKAYGLPSGATSLEGYLFPATYDLEPNKTPQEYFQLMVDTMKEHLTAAGVKQADWQHEIVFASLIQKEAGLAADFPKVARVFQNRIDQGMLLQSDATVAYGAGITGRVTTTDAERADASNPYNTYVHKGLPVGPISNPGDVALAAAAHPATGSWLFFVTVNLETGETVFSTSYAEHQAAVTQFQAWLRAHPSYNK